MLRKNAVNFFLLAIYFFEIPLSVSAPIDAECLSNPMSNPSECMTQIQDFFHQASSMKIDPNHGMSMGTTAMTQGPRKKAMVFDDDIEDPHKNHKGLKDMFKQFMGFLAGSGGGKSGDLNDLFRRLSLSNNIQGNEVKTDLKATEHNHKHDDISPEQLEQIARRLEIINKLKGKNVETHEKLTEINHAKEHHETSPRMAVKNDIKGNVVETKQDVTEYNDDPLMEIARALKKLAVKNEIKGSTVITKQDVAEINERDPLVVLVKVLKNLATKNDIKGDVVMKQNALEPDQDFLKQLTLKNDISGMTVDTKQDVTEYNHEDVLKELAKALQPLEKHEVKMIHPKVQHVMVQYNDDALGEFADVVTMADSLSRMAVSNNIEGVDVKTTQDVKEINEASKFLDDALQRLSLKNDIQGEVVKTDLKAEEFNDDIMQMMERLALKNKIEGNLVKTTQNVEQVNEGSEKDPMTVGNMIQGDKVHTVQDLKEYNDPMSRLAISNTIKGDKVETTQDVKEINDDLSSMARLAISNDIKGNRVETTQDLKEINDFIANLQRLALENKIQGNLVKTEQNVAEINLGVDMAQSDEVGENKLESDDEILKESEDEMLIKIDKHVETTAAPVESEVMVMAQEDYVEQPQPQQQTLQHPGLKALQDQFNLQMYNEMLKRLTLQNSANQLQGPGGLQNGANQLQTHGGLSHQLHNANALPNNNPNQLKTPGALHTNPQQIPGAFQFNQIQSVHSPQQQFAYQSKTLYDEIGEQNDIMRRREADEEPSITSRRMTINNNLSNGRRMSIDNKITGNKVETVQHVAELKHSAPIHVTAKPITPVLECKTSDGKTVYEADLDHFRKLLANIRDAEKAVQMKIVH